MTIEFACESCGTRGRVDAAMVGRRARCRQCKHVFTILEPGRAPDPTYALADPGADPAGPAVAMVADAPDGGGSTFIRTYRDAPLAPVRHDSPRAPRRRPSPGTGTGGAAFGPRLRVVVGIAAAGAALAVASLVVPGFGMVGGAILTGAGVLLVLVGWGAGAYGAFCEDLLYGIAYVVFPIYAGYYLVTRWDDLWPWFACSTVGAGLVVLGAWTLRLSGVG